MSTTQYRLSREAASAHARVQMGYLPILREGKKKDFLQVHLGPTSVYYRSREKGNNDGMDHHPSSKLTWDRTEHDSSSGTLGTR